MQHFRRHIFFWLATLTMAVAVQACLTPRKGPAKALAAAEATQAFDAVIIPGIPYHKTGWDSVMKARVLWSWVLYKNGLAKNIIYSGGAVYTPFKEAVIMGLYGQELGIPKEHMFYDTLARHSTENVYFSYQLAKKLGFKSIALATDPFQSIMLRGFTRRRFGTPVFHLPFVVDSLSVYNYQNPVIDPRPAYVHDWTGIKEKQGFWTRMKGTLGKDIDWSKHPNGMLEPL